MRGHIQPRGKSTWRLKYDVAPDPKTGSRRTRYATFRGTKRQAEDHLTKLMAADSDEPSFDAGTTSLAAYLRSWIVDVAASISPKTIERYRQLVDRQIVPHLGSKRLQKLSPTDIAHWHGVLLQQGRHDGTGLSAQSIRHAHRVLHKALCDAVDREILIRNPASRISPPKSEAGEVAILSSDQVTTVIDALRGTEIFPHVMILISSGIRRGELMALQWGDIDLNANTLRVQRSIEATKSHGLRIKPPKTRHGRRTITLPAIAITALKEHRAAEHEIRLALGLGKVQPTDCVFGSYDGKPRHPDWITYHWAHSVNRLGLPKVTLHALRHSHASALIAGGQDVVTVSRRLGHASPTITLSVYAHLFAPTDQAAADTIEDLLKPKANKS